MSAYLVSITPISDSRADTDVSPQMVIRVELSDGEPHVVELTVRVEPKADFGRPELPQLDLELLARAFGGRHGPAHDDVRSAHDAPAVLTRARPARRSPVADRPPAVEAAASNIGVPRAYRRMPRVDELQRVYADVGTVAGVAKHFDVPTHTAQGWIGRLRKQGVTEPRV